jgi:hypothetical protein
VTHFARFRVAALFGVTVVGIVALAGLAFRPNAATVAAAVETTKPYTPTYTKDGDLVPPLQYREWVYLTTGLGMNYTPKASDMPSFDNVFVNPEAYHAFQATGTWPDKTVIMLEGRQAQSKGSINKSGHFQSGGITGLEIHIKDESRFPGKWAFFDVASETKATLIPSTANCYSCHAEHAAVDTTFVQFYPTLLPIAQKKGTLSASYLKEAAAETAK